MTWFHAARARLRLLAPRAAESRIDDEIRFHIEMETERLVREQQLDRDEARRRALVTFGGLAMAFGIWFGAVTVQMFGIITSTKLPLPDGDRIVKIQSWDLKMQADEDRVLYDYQLYRGLRSITDLGAYRDATVNLVGEDRRARPAVAAEITASA